MTNLILCLIPFSEKNHKLNHKTIKRIHLREEEFRKNPEKEWDKHFNSDEINQSIIEYCNEFFVLGYSSVGTLNDLISYLNIWTTQLFIPIQIESNGIPIVSHFQECKNGICYTNTSDYMIGINEETYQWIHMQLTPQIKPTTLVKLIQNDQSIKKLKEDGFLIYNYKEF